MAVTTLKRNKAITKEINKQYKQFKINKDMKKYYNSTVKYNGRMASITATVTDENGYISITGELIPYRCKTAHISGCIHDYIYKAFPCLRPFIWLHLVNVDGSKTYDIENSLYMLANDDVKSAQSFLNCSDDEINDLYNLVRFGLHREKTWWGYNDNKTGYQVTGDGVKKYTAAFYKLGLIDRRKKAIRDLYEFINH